MSEPGRLVVLISGSGTNLQAILDACDQTNDHSPTSNDGLGLNAEVVLVISSNADAYGSKRAEQAGVPVTVLPFPGDPRSATSQQRDDYDTQVAYEASVAGADLVVLAGWNLLLGPNILSHHTVINLHPAKPGAFPGLGAIKKAYEAWRRGEVTSGGVMVHYVPDEGVDSGPVIAWEEIDFVSGEDLASYEQRVHTVEHRLLVEAIGLVLPKLR